MGACCSMSRQALIFKRRQTQQSGSDPASVVVAPQTVHLEPFRMRSAETARFACSRIWGETTGSNLGFNFLFMWRPLFLTMAETGWPNNQTFGGFRVVGTSLSRFRYLYDDGDVQAGCAAGTFLAGRDAGELTPQVDIGRHGVRADWTVSLTQDAIFDERFHFPHLI
jgi:hypothetical protein